MAVPNQISEHNELLKRRLGCADRRRLRVDALEWTPTDMLAKQ